MKYALAIMLLCAACSSGGGHSRQLTYPPGYVLAETVLRGEVWERWEWTQATDTRPAGTTVFEYRQ